MDKIIAIEKALDELTPELKYEKGDLIIHLFQFLYF